MRVRIVKHSSAFIPAFEESTSGVALPDHIRGARCPELCDAPVPPIPRALCQDDLGRMWVGPLDLSEAPEPLALQCAAPEPEEYA